MQPFPFPVFNGGISFIVPFRGDRNCRDRNTGDYTVVAGSFNIIIVQAQTVRLSLRSMLAFSGMQRREMRLQLGGGKKVAVIFCLF